VGGGPAGMEAAILADRRGHDVMLWERSDRLGGNLNLAPVPSGKSDMKSFLDYLNKELQESGVKVTLRKKASPGQLTDAAPDAVVLATGSRPFVVDIPGMGRENVVGFSEVLSGEKDFRDEKIVVWGAGFVGCEVAYFLAEKGNDVTLIFPESEPAPEVAYPDNRKILLRKLEENRVRIEVGIKEFKEIRSGGIALVDKEGKDVFFEADHIVLATGARPLNEFTPAEKQGISELYEAGDCVEVRRLLEAVREGAEAALKL